MSVENNVDFTLAGGPAVYLLEPLTMAAHMWVYRNVSEERTTWDSAIAIEHGDIEALLRGIHRDGLMLHLERGARA